MLLRPHRSASEGNLPVNSGEPPLENNPFSRRPANLVKISRSTAAPSDGAHRRSLRTQTSVDWLRWPFIKHMVRPRFGEPVDFHRWDSRIDVSMIHRVSQEADLEAENPNPLRLRVRSVAATSGVGK